MQLSRTLVPFSVFLVVGSVCRTGEAANICGETVAANRMVDGIPAYSQCSATTSSSIYPTTASTPLLLLGERTGCESSRATDTSARSSRTAISPSSGA